MQICFLLRQTSLQEEEHSPIGSLKQGAHGRAGLGRLRLNWAALAPCTHTHSLINRRHDSKTCVCVPGRERPSLDEVYPDSPSPGVPEAESGAHVTPPPPCACINITCVCVCVCVRACKRVCVWCACVPGAKVARFRRGLPRLHLL